jgi:ferric-dicitrate binding protein FerR (iron transport regulator)
MKPMNVDLITKYLAGEADPDEKKKLEEWLNSNPGKREEFLQTEKLWQAINISRNYDPDYISIIFSRIKTRFISKNNRKSGFKIYFRRMAAAALIIICFGAAYYFTRKQTFTYKSESRKIEINLPDNSFVVLNKGSELVYTHKQWGKRESRLSGEAYFDIKPSEKRPFIITTGSTEITVVGTTFYVSAYNPVKHTKVKVTSGTVKLNFSDNDNPLILNEGESGEADILNKKMQKYNGFDENSFAWNTGRLVFKNAKLKEVFEVLEENYELNIQVNNAKINELKFTGIFENTTLPVILETLSNTFQLKVINDLYKNEVVFYF